MERGQGKEGMNLPVSFLVAITLWIIAGSVGAVYWAGSISEKISSLQAASVINKADADKTNTSSAQRIREVDQQCQDLQKELQEVKIKVGILESNRRR